ncbi:MAG: pilin [Patescibacteria group bacterium]
MNPFSFLNFVIAQQSTFQLPPGDPITYQRLTSLLDNTAKFLYTAGVTLGVVAIVVSGIMYFMAGSDTKAEKAKGWFRNGVIGAFIILAVGVIIKTIQIIVEGRFF